MFLVLWPCIATFQGLASADHTTLLLNCYTKLKDVDKLDAFIHKGAVSSASAKAVGSSPLHLHRNQLREGQAAAGGREDAGASVLSLKKQSGNKADTATAENGGLKFDAETAVKVWFCHM